MKRFFYIVLVATALVGTGWSSCYAEGDSPTLSLRDFSGGLNTATSPYLLKPNELVRCMNFDLSREYGALTLRKGYRKVSDSLYRTVASTYIQTGHVLSNLVAAPDSFFRRIYVKMWAANGAPAFPSSGFYDGKDIHRVAGGTDVYIMNHTRLTIDTTVYELKVINDANSALFAANDSVSVSLSTAVYATATDTGGVTGVYNFTRRNGDKYLMSVTPGFGSQNTWGALYSSFQGKYQPQVRLAEYIYKGTTPIWATWNNNLFVALPRQRPLFYDGVEARDLIPRAQGQIDAIPLRTAGPLRGSYRYSTMSYLANGGAARTRMGYVTPAIRVDSEKVLLRGFSRTAPDSQYQVSGLTPDTLEDLVDFRIVRTKGYPLNVRPRNDTFWYVSARAAYSPKQIDTLTFIDSTSDAALTTVAFILGRDAGATDYDSITVAAAVKLYDTSAFYVNQTWTALGAPTFHSQDTVAAGAMPTWVNSTKLNSFDSTWYMTSYTTTLLDTLTGAESDTSPNLYINHGKGALASTVRKVIVGLPQLQGKDTSLVRVLYRRGGFLSTIKDTFALDTTLNDTIFAGWGHSVPEEEKQSEGYKDRNLRIRKMKRYIREFQWTPPFAVALIKNPKDSVFRDSGNTWYNLFGITNIIESRRGSTLDKVWRPNFPLNNVAGFFPWNDAMFAWQGSRLLRSVVDSPGTFPLFENVAFNLDDGDEIVQVSNIGENLGVFKNKSHYILYDPVGGLPTKSAAIKGIGCMAAQSMINDNGVLYYLSAQGVVSERSGENITHEVRTGVISQKINNLILGSPRRPDSTLKKAVATYISDERKYLLCFPDSDTTNDTTFVYHVDLDAWTTYDFTFYQATNYDDARNYGLVPPSRTVFSKAGDERFFEFGGSTAYYLDSAKGSSSNGIAGVARTRPLDASGDYVAMQVVGLQQDSIGASVGSGLVAVSAIPEDGTTGVSSSFRDNLRYVRKSLPVNGYQYPSVLITTSAGSPVYNGLKIRGIDIWARPIARPTLQ